MKCFALLLAAACSAATLQQAPDLQAIVARSSAAMDTNWKAAPHYTYVERDIQSKHGGSKKIKTYRVYLIEGSQYNELLAIDDKPLGPADQAREVKKLADEIEKRKHEGAGERARRIEKYQKERQQDHALMTEMTKAFAFTLSGQGLLNGMKVWVLDANPKPGYQPKSAETKVLTGMKGRLWISKDHFQWVKVQAEVTRPISLYGVLAKVQPGTRFELEQAPVAPGIWLPKHFSTDVNATALGIFDESSTDDESYRDYKPMSGVSWPNSARSPSNR